MPGRPRAKPGTVFSTGRPARPPRANPPNRSHLPFFVLDWQDPVLIEFHPCPYRIRYTISLVRAVRSRNHSPARETSGRTCRIERSLVSSGATLSPVAHETTAVSPVDRSAQRRTIPCAMGNTLDGPWRTPLDLPYVKDRRENRTGRRIHDRGGDARKGCRSRRSQRVFGSGLDAANTNRERSMT